MESTLKALAPVFGMHQSMPPKPTTAIRGPPTDPMPSTYNEPPTSFPPTNPVMSASTPPSGSRKDTGPFDGLSPELAIYGYRRTISIMKGAKAGC